VTGILIVRHGQSEWNAAGRWQGQEDPPLSSLGRAQATAAAERVGTVDLVVASDLQRAVETAATIAEAIGVGPVLIEPGLRERHAGEWQGLTKAEIEEGWPGYLHAGDRPPGFEPTDTFSARVHDALDRLEAAHRGATMLVVSHGGVVYIIEEHHGLPFERVANLAGRHLTHHGPPRGVELGERVDLVAEVDLSSVPTQL
jgi:broad specificity phosphatase PhoE